MTAYEQKVPRSSLAVVDMEKNNYFIDDYTDSAWAVPEDQATFHQAKRSIGLDHPCKGSHEFEDFLDGDYDSGDEHSNSVQQTPEVNLKNVLSGIMAIVTGSNKDTIEDTVLEVPGSDVAFIGSAKNGDTYLHPSVYIPSAPPLLEPSGINYNTYKEVLEAEPPEWLRDSSTSVCMQCNAPFTALTRGRHHCRLCGGIFCRACSRGRCLLPIKFRERNPQRVCDTCYDMLDPLQGVLINTISNAVQVAKHDVMDWTCTRGWLNLPVGLSMEHEIYKSSNTLRNYSQVLLLIPHVNPLLLDICMFQCQQIFMNWPGCQVKS